MYILGSGLAGCLAAIQYDKAIVLERAAGPNINHKALLRMSTESVSHLTGIPFKRVEVRKFIYSKREYRTWATPADIVQYSIKVSKTTTNRSIQDLTTEVRFIPPPNFHEILLTRLSGRIHYGNSVVEITENYIEVNDRCLERYGIPIISTIPLSSILKATNSKHELVTVGKSHPINVSRLKLLESDLYMTIYYPDPLTDVYRASIHGDMLTVESMSVITANDIEMVIDSFGGVCVEHTIDFNHVQMLGKISKIDDVLRKSLIYELTQKLNIYSLGRFACWRDVLLDDVVKDIKQINKMMSTHPYERALG